MDCVRKTAAEGMGSFYKGGFRVWQLCTRAAPSWTFCNDSHAALIAGTTSPLIGVGFMVSIQFGVLEAAKRALVKRKLAAGDKPDLSLTESEHTGLACLAAAFATLFRLQLPCAVGLVASLQV